jgi:hypothetical protein
MVGALQSHYHNKERFTGLKNDYWGSCWLGAPTGWLSMTERGGAFLALP